MFRYKDNDLPKEEYEELENILSDLSDFGTRVIFWGAHNYSTQRKRYQHIAINKPGGFKYEDIYEILCEAVDRLKEVYEVEMRASLLPNSARINFGDNVPEKIEDVADRNRILPNNYLVQNIWIDLYPKKVVESFTDFFKKKTKFEQNLEKLLSLSISDLNYILCDISDEVQIYQIPGVSNRDFRFGLEFSPYSIYGVCNLKVDEKSDKFKSPSEDVKSYLELGSKLVDFIFTIKFYTRRNISMSNLNNDLHNINDVVERIKDFGGFQLTNTSHGVTGTEPSYNLWELRFKY